MTGDPTKDFSLTFPARRPCQAFRKSERAKRFELSTSSLGSGEPTIVSDADKQLAAKESAVCTPVGTSDTENHPLAQLAGPHTCSPSSDPELVRIIRAWPTLRQPFKHAILAVLEAGR